MGEVKTPKKKKLTIKQRNFVKDYVELGNGTRAALKNYNTDNENTASSIATENLQKPEIVSEIEAEYALAKSIIKQIAMEGEVESNRLTAARDIADRTGGKPSQVIHQNIITDADRRDKLLDRLTGL